MRTPWIFLWIVLVAACAEGPREAPDADCQLFMDGGCPAATACRLVAEGEARCVAPAASPDEGCRPESCAGDEACVTVEGLLECRPLCRLDGSRRCPNSGQCTYPVDGAPNLGVCSQPCALGDDCGPSGTCAPSGTTPYPICVASGPGELGEACSESRCNAGLACLTVTGVPRCYALCTVGSGQDCGGAGCSGMIASTETLGYCPLP